jgi:hypothetical protein
VARNCLRDSGSLLSVSCRRRRHGRPLAVTTDIRRKGREKVGNYWGISSFCSCGESEMAKAVLVGGCQSQGVGALPQSAYHRIPVLYSTLISRINKMIMGNYMYEELGGQSRTLEPSTMALEAITEWIQERYPKPKVDPVSTLRFNVEACALN